MANELVKKTADTVKSYLVKNKQAIMSAMPTGANFERFCRTSINAISTTPALAECTVDSLFLSCIKAFSVGIEPNGPTQEGYLVPFKDHGVSKAQFMPSYRGLIGLARRSGMVGMIFAEPIYKNDKYKIQKGTDPKLEHEPNYSGDRGEIVLYYAVSKLLDGTADFEVMTPNDIDAIKTRSSAIKAQAYLKGKGKDISTPWDTDEIEMCKKTVIKRLTKRLPVSVENLAFAKAVQIDNKVSMGEMDDVIDIEGVEVPKAEISEDAESKGSSKFAAKTDTKFEDYFKDKPVTAKDMRAYITKKNDLTITEESTMTDAAISDCLNWIDGGRK